MKHQGKVTTSKQKYASLNRCEYISSQDVTTAMNLENEHKDENEKVRQLLEEKNAQPLVVNTSQISKPPGFHVLGIETNYTADDYGGRKQTRFPKKKMAMPPRISADVTNQAGRGSIEQSFILADQSGMIETPKLLPRSKKKSTLINEDIS